MWPLITHFNTHPCSLNNIMFNNIVIFSLWRQLTLFALFACRCRCICRLCYFYLSCFIIFAFLYTSNYLNVKIYMQAMQPLGCNTIQAWVGIYIYSPFNEAFAHPKINLEGQVAVKNCCAALHTLTDDVIVFSVRTIVFFI